MDIRKWLSCLVTICLCTMSLGAPALAVDAADGIVWIENAEGPVLGYSAQSGVAILEVDGLYFKDLNENGVLDTYEDWRLDAEARAVALVELMSADGEEGLRSLLGLLYHPSAPVDTAVDKDGQLYEFLANQKFKHILARYVESDPLAIAAGSNALQVIAEGMEYGIPINISVDPMHGISGNQEIWESGTVGNISQWPSNLGIAATFSTEIAAEYGNIAGIELRNLGVATHLAPQIDLGTDPRWGRLSGTFGEDAALAADLSQAYVEKLQTTYSEDGVAQGWGTDSIIAMIKHFPGGGTGEGGRDAHNDYGKFGVYPGDNLETQLAPFISSMNLAGGTESAAAVMPYYTISYGQDPSGNNVGNAFSDYILNTLLRGELGFDGVVCTDWGVSVDGWTTGWLAGTPWGVEDIPDYQRIALAWQAGTDQIGIMYEIEGVALSTLEKAYTYLAEQIGEDEALSMIQASARRLLKNMFRLGLFENPYVNSETTVVGNAEFMEAGYNAQLKSVVMLKNHDGVIAQAGAEKKTVYISGMDETVASEYFNVTENPDEADFAIVAMDTPSGGFRSGYDSESGEYYPISLQYGEYTADTARETSIAADPGKVYVDSNTGETLYVDEAENRSYKGKTVTASNYSELENLQSIREQMNGKPVVVYIKASNPLVFTEVEPLADGIVMGFSVSDQAVLDIISGRTEPSALLPVQMPVNMETVEAQLEDVGRDMDCYVDTDGNTYDFAFGLNWAGVIQDERVAKYY